MKLAFVYNPGRLARLEKVAKGEAPSEFFLGAIELTRQGHAVTHIEVAEEARGLGGRFWKALYSMGLLPPKAYGGIVAGIYSDLKQLNAQDVVIATTSGIGFALGLWKKLGMLEPSLIVVHCGLMNFPVNAWRRWCMSALLRESTSFLYGDGELAPMQELFHVPSERLRVNLFGVDLSFWTPDTGPVGDYILAVGNDGRRDYTTLIKAAEKLGVEMKLVTRQALPEKLPANVTVIKGSWHDAQLTDAGLRDLYRRARCVVVPLLPSFQPSGQSVALQAMACGRPVILTDTEGLWSRVGLGSGLNLLFVKPQDPAGMVDAINRIVMDPAGADQMGRNARRYVETYGNIATFASGIEAACNEVSGGTRD